MARDSIGQQLSIGDLVAYNLSGSIALGRIVDFNEKGEGFYRKHNFKIELIAGPGESYMNKDERGKHISKVKYYNSVLKITGVPNGQQGDSS